MTDHPFHTTRIGQDFLDKTMPALVKEIARLNELPERIARAMQKTLLVSASRTWRS